MVMSKGSIIILIVCVVAVGIQVILYSQVTPTPFAFQSNSKLQEVIKLGKGILKQPEDVAFDKMGVLYTSTRDGFIKRMHKNGTWDTWWQIDSDAMLGLTVTKAGHLIVCDAEKGLLKVSDEGVTVLTSQVNGTQIRFADAVVESSDGTLYFSVPSTKYNLQNWQFDLLEGTPYGQVLKYDPIFKETSILLDNLDFANGVALSDNEDFLVVCETKGYRCLKYWLKGDNKGKIEVFIDNLPGGPDNIKLAPDGSFWIALVHLTPSRLKYIQTLSISKYIIRKLFPNLSHLTTGVTEKATVVNVASNGKMIIRGFDDPIGQVITFVTSVLEFDNHLYLGNLHCDFIGKLQLTPLN